MPSLAWLLRILLYRLVIWLHCAALRASRQIPKVHAVRFNRMWLRRELPTLHLGLNGKGKSSVELCRIFFCTGCAKLSI